jgi:hypothetical protein
MGNISLKFEARDDHGNNMGDYEMFIDLTSTVSNPTNLMLEVPTGWAVQAIKFYQVAENSSGGFTPSAQKKADIASLRSGSLSSFNSVFSNLNTPAGFSFQTSTNTLTDNGQSPGAFEYLIWIQQPSTSGNDFIDPGIRNH